MGPLRRECRSENLIATIRGTVASVKLCGRAPSAWRVGLDFWAAFENFAVVRKVETIAEEDIEKAWDNLPQPTMHGIPVFVDQNMERNKAALVTKDGDVVTIIELEAPVGVGIKTGEQ